jgi:hypothetical protein
MSRRALKPVVNGWKIGRVGSATGSGCVVRGYCGTSRDPMNSISELLVDDCGSRCGGTDGRLLEDLEIDLSTSSSMLEISMSSASPPIISRPNRGRLALPAILEVLDLILSDLGRAPLDLCRKK